MAGWLDAIFYSGKSQGTSGCSCPSEKPKSVGTYYLTGEEFVGILGEPKVGLENGSKKVSVCDNQETLLENIVNLWKKAAKIVFNNRHAPASPIRNRFLNLDDYREAVANAVLGKILSLKHKTARVKSFSSILTAAACNVSNNPAPKEPIALDLDDKGAEVKLALKKAEETKVEISPPDEKVKLFDDGTAEIKFNLVPPTVTFPVNLENSTKIKSVEEDFSDGSITLALSQAAQSLLIDKDGNEKREVAVKQERLGNKAIQLKVRIKVPDKLIKDLKTYRAQCRPDFFRDLATEAMLGNLIIKYNGSKLTSISLYDFISPEKTETPPPVDTTPKITGIHPSSVRIGTTRRTITISGKNIPSDATLTIDDNSLTITPANVSRDGKNITTRITVPDNPRLIGRKNISVINSLNETIGSVNFHVLGKYEPPPPPPPPPPTPTDPCAKKKGIFFSSCCKNNPSAPSCKKSSAPAPAPAPTLPPIPEPKPEPKPASDPCANKKGIFYSACCKNNPSAESCQK